jgi:WXXGXW repeat (2 copies)
MKRIIKPYRKVLHKMLNGPAMQRNSELQKQIHKIINKDPHLKNEKPGLFSSSGKYLKILSYLILFSGMSLFFSSCVGYVESEPSFVESARPARPGDAYIWIDGGWRWDTRSHVYIRRPGHWEMPRHERSYEAGHWESTPRGKRWVDGHWSKQNEEENHHDR